VICLSTLLAGARHDALSITSSLLAICATATASPIGALPLNLRIAQFCGARPRPHQAGPSATSALWGERRALIEASVYRNSSAAKIGLKPSTLSGDDREFPSDAKRGPRPPEFGAAVPSTSATSAMPRKAQPLRPPIVSAAVLLLSMRIYPAPTSAPPWLNVDARRGVLREYGTPNRVGAWLLPGGGRGLRAWAGAVAAFG